MFEKLLKGAFKYYISTGGGGQNQHNDDDNTVGEGEEGTLGSDMTLKNLLTNFEILCAKQFQLSPVPAYFCSAYVENKLGYTIYSKVSQSVLVLHNWFVVIPH